MIFNVCSVLGQVAGTVVDFDNYPLENVLIMEQDSEQWTVSSKDGAFLLFVNHYPVKLIFKYLGKQKQVIEITKPINDLKIRLLDDNFKLNEVVVTAKTKKNALGSNILLEKKAIELVQAQSLADVLQLIPGKNIAESDLHNRQLLTLRSAIFNNTDVLNMKKGLGQFYSEQLINNSFGVGYLINDIPLNNNLELSGNRGLVNSPFSNINDFGTAGMGVDIRNISIENIESIEVVQGVSSVRYGDHNTGLIKVNKKIGVAPYRIHTTLRGGAYSVHLSKGVNLPNKLGAVNCGLEYLHSNENPRNTLSKYDRITMSSIWQYLKRGVLKNKLSVSLMSSINSKNEERSKTLQRKKSLESQNIRVDNKTNFYFDSSYIDNMEIALSLDYSYSDIKHEQLINNGGRPVMNSLKEGTFRLGYTPVNYTTLEEVNNIPISFFSRVELNKNWLTESGNYYKISLGANVVIEDNVGKGTVYDKERLPFYATLNSISSGNVGWRNINFNKMIPTRIQCSSYLNTESKIVIYNNINLESEVGVRYDNFNNKSAFSPRGNFKIKWNDKFSTRFGVGLFSKAPALQFIYNFPSYHDFLLGDFRNNYYAFALGHTVIRNRPKNDVKPSRMYKMEVGVDYRYSLMNISLTGYMNRLYDGFSTVQQFENMIIPKYKFTFYDKKEPQYELVGQEKRLISYSKNINGLSAINKGIECIINTKKIPQINMSFNASLAYRYTKNQRDLPSSFVISENPNPSSDIFIGLHKEKSTVFKTLKGSLTGVYHISRIGLVLSLTAEQFFIATNTSYGRTIYPYAYYDKQFNYFEIPENERKSMKYSYIRKSGNNTVGASSYIPRMYGNYHLKMSKEFDNGLQFSFYAINFLNYMPRAEVLSSNGELKPITLNSPISFGGNIKYKF